MNAQTKEQFSFTKAERKKAKLKLNLNGASGSGKTYSALVLASSLFLNGVCRHEHFSPVFAPLYTFLNGVCRHEP